MLNFQLRRSLSLAIPIFSAVALLGVTESIFEISVTENLLNTGITFGMILGALNIFLFILISKHQVP